MVQSFGASVLKDGKPIAAVATMDRAGTFNQSPRSTSHPEPGSESHSPRVSV
jgi:hypothetical protein